MHATVTRTALAALVLLGATHAALAANVSSKQVALGTLGTPASALNFGNSFSVASGLVSSAGGQAFSASDTFYDTYTFTVPAAGFSSFTAALDLGDLLAITGLQSRLYAGNPLPAGTGLAGNPALINAWSTGQSNAATVAAGTGLFNMINVPSLAAGTYTLEVRGQVVGSAGGAYAGVLNVAAVPEPSTYLLLSLGMGLMALRIRRARD